MDSGLQAQIETYLSQLARLIERGSQLRASLQKDRSSISEIAATRVWQEHCGVTINQLSGGSKAHWLARAFSEAFLMRSATGEAIEMGAPEKIVERLLSVLEQAVASLSRNDAPVLSTSSAPPEPRRFDFVHNAELRPMVEAAYTDGRRALEDGEFDLALRTSCAILEAIVTDALEHHGRNALKASGAPVGSIADWPFETRLVVAEKAGLIRGGWVRLPEVARKYRGHGEEKPEMAVSETDARRARQVLHVIMRDLNPGR